MISLSRNDGNRIIVKSIGSHHHPGEGVADGEGDALQTVCSQVSDPYF